MNEKKPSKSTLDDLNTQLPQEYQKFTEACLEIRRLSRSMSAVTGVSRRWPNREPGRSRFVRINPLPSKSHEFADQWSTPVVQFDRSTYWWRDKNRRFNVPTADQHANASFLQRRNIFFFFSSFFFFHTLFFKLMKHANRTRNDQSGILRFLNFLTGEKTFFYSFFNNKHKYFTFHAFICYNDNLCNINWARTMCFEKREKKYRSSSKELNVSFKAEWKWNEQNEASKYARYMVKSRNARTVEEATRIGKGTRKEEEQESRRRRVQGKKGLEGSREGKATTFWWFILQYWPAISQRVENLFTR